MKKIQKSPKLIPLGDRVLIEPIVLDTSSKTKSGIYLPENIEKQKPEEGIVVAIGEGKKLKVGDKVIFSKYAYEEVNVGDKEYLMFKEENILVLVENE